MPESEFFNYYSKNEEKNDQYLMRWKDHLQKLTSQIPELPFSNVWIAGKIHNVIPDHSSLHLAILNSLRSWNFFNLPETVHSNTNVGGFGIDGCLSSLIGSSLTDKNRLYFGIIGDLSFFYDLNSLGNRNVGKNLRILLINNGTGMEFRNFTHLAAQFGESADEFIAAGGHFGNKSLTLVKNYSENLGFEYLSASNKEEFEKVYERFLTNEILDKPILLEAFTNTSDENKALEMITSITKTTKGQTKSTIINAIGKDNVRKIKKMIKGL
jgi:2-succinyl-5-enolpyruvyl-6-hydroxy-3-cyclohexene-1-carboxylate synthase